MLEGNPVEKIPEEWIRELENWVAAYPEEGRGVANALSDAAERIRGTGLTLRPMTWSMIGEPEPRRWLIDQWLPAGSVALLTGEGGAGKSRLALQLAAGIATNHPNTDSWIEGADAPKIGNAVPNGGTPVVYTTWEDRTDEMARRLSQISGQAAPWCEPAALENLKILDLAGYGPAVGHGHPLRWAFIDAAGTGSETGGRRYKCRPIDPGLTGRGIRGQRKRQGPGPGFHGILGCLGNVHRLRSPDHRASSQVSCGLLGLNRLELGGSSPVGDK